MLLNQTNCNFFHIINAHEQIRQNTHFSLLVRFSNYGPTLNTILHIVNWSEGAINEKNSFVKTVLGLI